MMNPYVFAFLSLVALAFALSVMAWCGMIDWPYWIVLAPAGLVCAIVALAYSLLKDFRM